MRIQGIEETSVSSQCLTNVEKNIRAAIEERIGGMVSKMETHWDPVCLNICAARAWHEGEMQDFIVFDAKRPVRDGWLDHQLEEAEFDSWPLGSSILQKMLKDPDAR